MKKLAFTFGTAIALFAGTAAAETVLRIGHGANEQYHMHRALLHFEEQVETGSNGEIDVQIFPSSQMGPDREMIESVQAGVLEMAVSPSSFFAGWDQAFAVIELPYMYSSKDIALDVLNGDAGGQMLARLSEQGLVGLGWLENGLRHVTNNVRPIESPGDLEGVKLRTMKVPAHVATFEALGANPTPMNFGEVYSALQQGVIDGQENPVALIDSQRFYEVQKHVSLTGHVFTVYIPVISEAFFSGLSAEHQQLLRDAMASAESYQQDLVNSEEAGQLQKIREAGVNVVDLTAKQRQVFSDQTESVRAAYRDEVGADVFDAWVSAVRDSTPQ
ncbi:tripartite ATP-independent transporter DctP family solute receptor [Labrenzia sp. EL_159]|uniref:TRAP transporter substrate-binding protein n=1 Tax=Roseibium album TaxID=311410 RepID=UPI0018C9A6A4|nr:TRAP transporter substrate-binding protein [Roseibium album]MBG6159896.1 tripartite ATP-independent transporter DctP family solute receptor [Labrenzia sp. EL_162]MBG6198428.1 tripartite ATP-independent transporter DctP family solute receptor [Labrenzia sp. EL_159]